MQNQLSRGPAVVPSLRVGRGSSFGQVLTAQEALFTENGAGTYTATLRLPAGSRIVDIGVSADVLCQYAQPT
jgi:hypothetical protein